MRSRVENEGEMVTTAGGVVTWKRRGCCVEAQGTGIGLVCRGQLRIVQRWIPCRTWYVSHHESVYAGESPMNYLLVDHLARVWSCVQAAR